MPRSNTDRITRVFTPPWNKRMAPSLPHEKRIAAAANISGITASEAAAAASGAQLERDDAQHPKAAQLTAVDEAERRPLSPQSRSCNQDTSDCSQCSDGQEHSMRCFPVVSLSTQMAQVSSPARPGFSPVLGGVLGQRRRLSAALEGLAEKYDVSMACLNSFEAVKAIIATHADLLLVTTNGPGLSMRAQALLCELQQHRDPCLVNTSVRSRNSSDQCMEGSCIFVCELQQLLHSLRDLDISPHLVRKLDNHVERLRSTLQASFSKPLAVPFTSSPSALSPQHLSPTCMHATADAKQPVPCSAECGARTEQRVAALEHQVRTQGKELQEALVAAADAQALLTHKDQLLELSGQETKDLSEQVSRSCSEVERLSDKLRTVAKQARDKDAAHKDELQHLNAELTSLQEEHKRLEVALKRTRCVYLRFRPNRL